MNRHKPEAVVVRVVKSSNFNPQNIWTQPWLKAAVSDTPSPPKKSAFPSSPLAKFGTTTLSILTPWIRQIEFDPQPEPSCMSHDQKTPTTLSLLVSKSWTRPDTNPVPTTYQTNKYWNDKSQLQMSIKSPYQFSTEEGQKKTNPAPEVNFRWGLQQRTEAISRGVVVTALVKPFFVGFSLTWSGS